VVRLIRVAPPSFRGSHQSGTGPEILELGRQDLLDVVDLPPADTLRERREHGPRDPLGVVQVSFPSGEESEAIRDAPS